MGRASTGRAICPETEHHAVLYPVEANNGSLIKVTETGDLDLEHFESLLDLDLSVISVVGK